MKQPYSISLKTTWRYILADIARYRVMDDCSFPAVLILYPGVVASIYYRIGHWIWYPAELNQKLLYPLRPFYRVGKRFVVVYSGASLSTKARIGRGLHIDHFGSIYVDASYIGENCNLSLEVTISAGWKIGQQGLPTVGDRVFVGAGAKILGPITVGDDVAVGANAVVTTDLADCSVAVGVPAKAISYKGSFDFVLYDDMEDDPARSSSLYERNMWEMRQSRKSMSA